MKKITIFVFAFLLALAGFCQQTRISTAIWSEENGMVYSPMAPGTVEPNSIINQSPDVMSSWVLPNTNSTSGNSRIPRNSAVRYQREEFLILPSEMAVSGFPSGATVDALGFLISAAGVGTQTGNLNIYLMNTNDITYTLGSTWTTTGFTQVSNDPAFTVPIALGAYSIPFTGGSTFTYTGGGVYVAWEFSNPAGALGTTALVSYCNTSQATLCYGYQNATTMGTTLSVTAFRPATSFTNNLLVDIAAVTNIYTTERVPVPFGAPNPVGVRVSNVSASAVTFDVTLTVKDVATSTTRYTATLPVTSLAGGASQVVSFPGWIPSLIENVTINATTSVIPGETYAANNTLTIPGEVNSNRYSYCYNLTNPGGYGYTTPGSGIFAAKYKMNGSGLVKGANVLIYNYAANPGNTVFAVVMNSAGTILAQSPDYILQLADMGVNVGFTFPTPQSFTNEDFYVGIAQTPGTGQWYPLGSITETPGRGNTFYNAAITGGALVASTADIKYAIEAVMVAMPTVITNAATSITTGSATLNGSVNANGENTTVTFQYGLTTAYGSTIAGVPGTATGTSATAQTAGITGLTQSTLYHFRAVGVSAGGTTYGNDLTFTTTAPVPIVVTNAASLIGATFATLNGTVTAQNVSTTATFEYGLTTAYGTVVAAVPGTINGNTATPVLANLTGLALTTTYHYRCIGVNSNGTTYGLDQQFATGCIPPTPTIAGPATACQNFANNVYTTQTGMMNYTWTVSAGGNITAGLGTSAITVKWTTSGAHFVSINYSNAGGCQALVPTVFNVTVSPSPVPTITGTSNLCANSGYYTYTTETGFSNYTWSISTGNTINYGQGTNQVMVTWSTPGNQSISVNYTSANGCQAGVPTALATTVNTVPGAAGAITGVASVCGGSTGIAYSVAAVPGAVSYVWSFPAGVTISSGAGTNNIGVDFAGNASSGNITVYANNLCGNGVISPSHPLTVSPLPEPAGIITGNLSLCEFQTGVVYSVANITNATSYTWTVPANATIVSGSGTNTITVNYTTFIGGFVTVAGTNSCGNGVAFVQPVQVFQTPAAPVITVAGAMLTSSAPTGNQWYKDGVMITGATSQTVDATPYGSGWYWDFVTLNGCSSDSSNHEYVLITGMGNKAITSCNIYPVPNDGRFTIVFPEGFSSAFTVRVINGMGQTVRTEEIKAVNNRISCMVDVRPLAEAIYTIEIVSKDFVITKKIVVKK